MKHFFAVLGGMGTMATEAFIEVLNAKTPAHSDQEYLNYLVMNHATVPDRTAYILGESNDSPYEVLAEDIQQLLPLHPDFFVLTCNTAHYFYDKLQALTDIPILHMPKLAVEQAKKQATKHQRVMILATTGTVQSGVYAKEFEGSDITAVVPDEALQLDVMHLIYDDIKQNNYLNVERYESILKQAIEKYQCDVAILGCTELSVMNAYHQQHTYPVVDAQEVLVNEVLRKRGFEA